ncbi:chromosome partitioning protein ParB, partial [bacterium]|nr:chromosome partitioning protein ParB [bacterium]
MADTLDPSMYSPEFGTAAKLTEWENEPTVLLLKEELDIAKQSHDDHVSQVKSWLDLRNVTGSVKPKTGENRSSVQPKLVRRQAEWRYSALSEPFHTAEDMFSVKPKTWEDTRAAEQNTLVLNYQFRTKLNRVRFIDEFTRTSVDEGTCVVRLGWLRETDLVEEEVTTWQYEEVVDQVTLDALQQAMSLRTENPN